MRTRVIVAVMLLASCGKGDGKGGKDDHGGRIRTGTEGDLQIDNIEALSKRYFVAHDNTFPQINVGPTPAQNCCMGQQAMCQPNAADWVGTDWDQLHFKMTDQAFRFQYSYKSDGQTVTATATSDLDCDPTNGSTTIELHGKVVNGEPSFDIVRTTEN
jgi:hypothetical protein